MDEFTKLIEDARTQWVARSATVMKDIERILNDLHKDLVERINSYSDKGKIPPQRLRNLQREVKRELAKARPKITGKIRKLHKMSIKAGIETSKDTAVLAGLIKKTTIPTVLWDTLNTQATKALTNYTSMGFPLSKRVWDLTWTAEKSIINRLQRGVIAGESSSSIAKDIKRFLVVPASPRGRRALDYRPGSGTYRSAYKNAERLARTEMNRAFVEGMYAYDRKKGWITGYIWRTGSGDPCPVCMDHNGDFYPKETPPQIPAHPNCMCYPEQQYSKNDK